VTGQPSPDGVQQQMEAALRDLSSPAGKRKAPEGSSSKQQQKEAPEAGGSSRFRQQ
jgi:hypothetical protein